MSYSIGMPPQIITGAIDAFMKKEFYQFDPIVGETACHIRAGKVYDLAVRMERDPTFAKEMINVKDGVSYTLSKDLEFLVQSYFLTVVKEKVQKGLIAYDERTIWKKATSSFQISTSAAEKLGKLFQKTLAEQTVDYVEGLAKPSLRKFFTTPYRVEDERGRFSVPCYFSMRALLKGGAYNHILLRCKQYDKEKQTGEVTILYGGKPYIPQYVDKTKIPREIANLPAMVIEGFSLDSDPHLVERIGAVSLKTILLANAAKHAQYTQGREIPFSSEGEDSERTIKEKEKFLAFARKADALGCSFENPRLFCVDHIFCDLIGRALS